MQRCGRAGADLRLRSVAGPQGRNARVYAAARRIPRGRVATYGDVAALAGLAGLPRQVGYALHALSGRTTVPWHRVINARGEISRRSVAGPELEQRLRLELEGVRFDARGRVSLATFGWPAPGELRRPRKAARWS